MPDNKFPLPGCTLCLGTAPAVVTSLSLLDAPLSPVAPLVLWRPGLVLASNAAGSVAADAEDVPLLLARVLLLAQVPPPLGMLLFPRENALLLTRVLVTVTGAAELLELSGGLLVGVVAGVLAVAAGGLAARGLGSAVRGLAEGGLAELGLEASPLEGVLEDGLLLLSCWY